MIDIREYQKACQDYNNRWALLNDQLYELCRNNPDHSSHSTINAKFYIIGRTYASGIERIRRNSNGEVANLSDLTEHIYSNRRMVEPIFEKLLQIKEPLTVGTLEIIVEEHGRFLTILKAGLKGRAPRSFASKYMHFHNSVVPIYDSIASSQLAGKCRWSKKFELFAMPEGADKDYYRFVLRFWQLYSHAGEIELRPTVRFIDNYLLWMAKAEVAALIMCYLFSYAHSRGFCVWLEQPL